MKNIYKLYFTFFVFSGFISVLIEKFMYFTVPFSLKRALIVMISLTIFVKLVYEILPNKYKTVLLDKTTLIFDFVYVNIKKFYISNFIIIAKYLFSFLITFYATLFLRDIFYLIFGICEILIILFITNLIHLKSHKAAYIINDILMLLYNINIFVLIYGGSFVNIMMVTNMDSIQALQGKFYIYLIGVILTFIFSFLPARYFKIYGEKKFAICLFAYELILIFFIGLSYSVFCNYGILVFDDITYLRKQYYIKHTKYKKKDFYNKDVGNFVSYNGSLSEKPNIIIIFAEGLSNNIIYDKRNIMPNVKKISRQSISFKNYYNHTAATYRGIIGQLYSGYQLVNTDKNNLISLQSILSKNGYNSNFINVEPKNKEFTKYLESFKFDNLITADTGSDILSDKEAYELLFKKASELNDEECPFLLVMYSFNTHVSFDSNDEVFKDGSDNLLNRFYNLDYQVGRFIDKFTESSLFDNTIVVFTTDHASYVDSDYIRVFKDVYDRKHSFYDKIPLMIYHKGIDSEVINANGRNSLDLAPTILDYVDISDENYFLGKSLFSLEGTKFDRVYYDTFEFVFDNKKNSKDLKYSNEVISNDISGYLSICSK